MRKIGLINIVYVFLANFLNLKFFFNTAALA